MTGAFRHPTTFPDIVTFTFCLIIECPLFLYYIKSRKKFKINLESHSRFFTNTQRYNWKFVLHILNILDIFGYLCIHYEHLVLLRLNLKNGSSLSSHLIFRKKARLTKLYLFNLIMFYSFGIPFNIFTLN